MRLRLIAAAAILTGSLFAADPELLSLAPPNSQLMAGVNVEQLMLSPLGEYLLAQDQQQSGAGLGMLMEKTGFHPTRDLREILVATDGQFGAGAGSVVILVRGTFDIPKILEAAHAEGGATVETYKGVSIVHQSKQESAAFPDSTLAIIGSGSDVRAAIDRKTSPTAISAALAVQVNQLSTTEDAWFVSMVSPAQLQPQASEFAFMTNVQQVSGGVKFGADVVVSLQAVSKTHQDAETLAALLKSLPGMAQMAAPKGEAASAAALLQSLNVTVDGPVAKVSLSVPESQIEQLMIKAGPAGVTGNVGIDPRVHTQPMQPAGRPAAATPQRIRVGGEVQKSKLLQHPDPVYPPLALQARISGVVRLNAVIGKDGTVENLTVISGHPLLVPSAMQAAKQWVYQPTLLNGQAVEVATQIEVNFSLSQ
jgi:TonB family protein